MFCPKCGERVKEEANFCVSCGNNLKVKQKINLDSPETQSPAQNVNKITESAPPSISEENLEELLKKLKKKAGEDAVNFAHITEHDEWVCVCSTVNLLDKKQKIQNCSKCHRNRDFALKKYAHPSLKNYKPSKELKKNDSENKISTQKLYEAILGEKNAIYYQTKFEQFDKKGQGLKASWNWPALFAGSLWALYRKMYGWFFILSGGHLISGILEGAGTEELSWVIHIIQLIAFPIFANSLYQNNLRKKITEGEKIIEDKNELIKYLRNKGGVHKRLAWLFWGMLVIIILGILIAIAIPSFLR